MKQDQRASPAREPERTAVRVAFLKWKPFGSATATQFLVQGTAAGLIPAGLAWYRHPGDAWSAIAVSATYMLGLWVGMYVWFRRDTDIGHGRGQK
jgi:hypothetical protein